MVLYDGYPATAQCQRLARLFRQPVTVFLRPLEETDHFEILWLTQNAERDLCGPGICGDILACSCRPRSVGSNLLSLQERAS
ncbi:hypothetical protein FNJ47_35720 [Bradyrhizobium sp. UFLA 03-164]|uniref:Uncharacterized protein n=1 Tax=Bradyrhizobium uaiense TaxID=2594946 RepID=A0A6P1BRY4_9BRAD|nr:hypothetical protein [Bradyrhizobium uaiense]